MLITDKRKFYKVFSRIFTMNVIDKIRNALNLCKDLKEENEKLKLENEELRKKIEELEKKLKKAEEELEKIREQISELGELAEVVINGYA